MCVGVLSVGLGPGLDSMSPARSRRSASHAAGTHGWLPQKTGRPGLRRGGVGGYNLHSVPPNSPPDCGTVAHQPRAGCIRLVRGVLSPILFNIYTSDIPLPPDSVQLTTFADDITITAPHTDINIAKANIQPYLQDILKWTKDNDLLLNTDKTTCTLFTPDPAEYNTQLGLQIDNTPQNTRTHT